MPRKQIKPNDSVEANFKARIVKQIIKSTKSISNKVSIKTALDEMHTGAIDPAPITDERGELLGTLSKNKMNREIGGMGHDPGTEPVAAHIQTNCAYCFEDQTIEEAERIMRQAKVGEAPVVTHGKLLVGAIDLKAISEQKDGGGTVGDGNTSSA